jgi:hypothetical protein
MLECRAEHGTPTSKGVADWRYEFVRGGGATTHKFIPGLSNAYQKTIRAVVKLIIERIANGCFILL